MADNTGRNIEEEKEFLSLQKQINDAAKEAGKSFRDAGNYTKTILANYIEMQKVSSRIKQIEKELVNATEERAAILRQELGGLKKQKDQIKEINKEMASLTNVARAGFSGIVSYIGQAITGYFEFSQKIKDSAASIGLSVDNMNMLQSNIQSASVQMARYGVGVQDAVAAQQAYSDELGRAVILSDAVFSNMAMVGKATGLGMSGMAGLTAQMDQFGMGAEQSVNYIGQMYEETSKMGLNSGKVIKKFESNLGLLNKLNFKNGVKGLAKMAQLSEKFGIEMQSVASVADKVFRPEGAIEAAAQLQVLGGGLAALGDPFQLMYKARNSPEELAKSLTKAASASATFNKETGEFVVNAYELDRLREAANALGMDYGELSTMAKKTAKINMFEGMLSGKGLSTENQEAVAMMAQMVDGKAKIQIGMDLKDLESTTKDELEKSINDKKGIKEAAEQATGIMERLQNFITQLMQAVYPLFHSLEKYFTPLLQALTEKTTGWAESLKNFFTNFDFSGFIDGIKDFFVGLWNAIKFLADHWIASLLIAGSIMVAPWLASQVAAGAIFGRSARMAMGIGGGGIGGAAGGGMTGAQTAMQGQAAKSAGMGSMMSSLGSAAQIISVGLALMMLAKSVQMFVDAALIIKQNDLGGTMLGLTVGLTAFIGLMGVLGMSGLGEAAILVIDGIGLGMLMMGGAVLLASYGISMIVDSFTKLFSVIGGGQLLEAGLGFLAMAAGVGILTISLIALGAASILALPGLLILGGVTSMLTETASALQSTGGAEGITKSINAINSVDESKLEALKDLSMWMALVGASPTIKFDESLKIDGSIEIAGAAGGKTNTDWVNDPIFVSKLKQLISDTAVSDRRGKA